MFVTFINLFELIRYRFGYYFYRLNEYVNEMEHNNFLLPLK